MGGLSGRTKEAKKPLRMGCQHKYGADGWLKGGGRDRTAEWVVASSSRAGGKGRMTASALRVVLLHAASKLLHGKAN